MRFGTGGLVLTRLESINLIALSMFFPLIERGAVLNYFL